MQWAHDRYAAVVKRQLVGPAELIEMLGVGRTRYAQLIARPDFPAPVAELVMGNVWELADIRAWAKKNGRDLHQRT